MVAAFSSATTRNHPQEPATIRNFFEQKKFDTFLFERVRQVGRQGRTANNLSFSTALAA